jgi:hypothetical protein
MKHHDFLISLKSLKSQIDKEKQTKLKSLHTYQHSNTIKSYCECSDSQGFYKYLYSSYEEIEYLLASKHIRLTIYPCPYEKGWHLSKG